MSDFIKADFHLHSNMSDGYFSPEALAKKLVAEDVYYAALTDHDSVAGQERFRKVAEKLGIVTLTGVELFTWFNDTEIHILAYGIDPENPDLLVCFGKPKTTTDVLNIIHNAGGKALPRASFSVIFIRIRPG